MQFLNEWAPHESAPEIILVPLPANAQFLNVIESVFSGMARAVIHNSDYADVPEAKSAISRYFKERNDHFLANPRRAGKTIWGRERTLSAFSETNNCKEPQWIFTRCSGHICYELASCSNSIGEWYPRLEWSRLTL